MHGVVVPASFALTLAATVLGACSTAPPAGPDTAVTRSGKVLHYVGYLSAAANAQVRALDDGAVTRLLIRSRGGDIDLGMELGRWVFDRGVDVEVDGYCLSSCANYVFPAGRRKILAADSQLGWHGGAMQADMSFASAADEAAYQVYIGPAREREAAFFHHIGVDAASTTYGQREEFSPFAACAGWRYSVEAMRSFGIDQVVLRDARWTPADSFDGRCVFLVEHVGH